jgi:predicted nucleic acid-binding protein
MSGLLAEVGRNALHRFRDDTRVGTHALVSPDVFPVEAGHALTRAERQLRITPPNGWLGWRAILADCPQLHPSLPLMPRAHALSSSSRVGIYDCLHVALAEREGCKFITADDKLIKNIQSKFPFVISLASMP